jgi:signal transduction histidine kinase
MSIRLRLTLLYSTILALTLVIFGAALYTIQARTTLDALKRDLRMSGERIGKAVLWTIMHPTIIRVGPDRPPPVPFESFSSDTAFQALREREIVRLLDAQGNLIASPFGSDVDALALSATGLQTLLNNHEWWEYLPTDEGRLLVYNYPVSVDGQLVLILQVARPLAERDRSLAALGTTLIASILLATLVAFGVGWVLSGVTLRPINRITQTAAEIGAESGANEFALTRRVDYSGPNDEIGQLARTFNTMLARLQEAYQRVSQALGMQREFVSDVSHELRTPLTTLRGNLALLSKQPPPPEAEREDILSDMVEESDRLIRLVNDLLVLARADAGRSLLKEPVPVRSLIEEACRQARNLDQGREIVEAAAEVSVLGDKDALKQILLILLDNAVKYSVGTIRVGAEAADGQVLIRVQDGGPGIPAEALPHLFDRFYRGEAGMAVPGFGLGLPIAKALAGGQGGTIVVESQPGSGSLVSIRLPEA